MLSLSRKCLRTRGVHEQKTVPDRRVRIVRVVACYSLFLHRSRRMSRNRTRKSQKRARSCVQVHTVQCPVESTSVDRFV
jgi:hypothetical protein